MPVIKFQSGRWVRRFSGVVLAAVLASVSSAYAHHNTAKFDFRSYETIEGIIKVADFRNPHSLIILEVTDENGQIMEHSIEGHSRNIIRRSGLTAEMVQPGVRVTLYFAPSRTDNDMFMRALRLPDGRVLNPGVTAIPEEDIRGDQE
ncbi:uncharacterized protein METZ01_LOCUS213686 [marine metagenome]|uniref:Uncharacterized protein n=1 Tax=marine metagenome TaxID=408172 RepID=A0A382FDX0_9ZZZZ